MQLDLHRLAWCLGPLMHAPPATDTGAPLERQLGDLLGQVLRRIPDHPTPGLNALHLRSGPQMPFVLASHHLVPRARQPLDRQSLNSEHQQVVVRCSPLLRLQAPHRPYFRRLSPQATQPHVQITFPPPRMPRPLAGVRQRDEERQPAPLAIDRPQEVQQAATRPLREAADDSALPTDLPTDHRVTSQPRMPSTDEDADRSRLLLRADMHRGQAQGGSALPKLPTRFALSRIVAAHGASPPAPTMPARRSTPSTSPSSGRAISTFPSSAACAGALARARVTASKNRCSASFDVQRWPPTQIVSSTTRLQPFVAQRNSVWNAIAFVPFSFPM